MGAGALPPPAPSLPRHCCPVRALERHVPPPVRARVALPARSGRLTPQEVASRNDIDAVASTDDEKVLVAGHNQGCSAADGRCQHGIIIRISRHRSSERLRLDDPHAEALLFQTPCRQGRA